ncbi:MAG: hypothetical protein DRQ56_03590 [Gammaproteobacteria bacterium]|nr:MAG: hypothetical protein DRQ56_03590 [Gammaproteobacteria bacterium]
MTMTDEVEYITHPVVQSKLDEATIHAIRWIRMEMEIRPCVSGCESFSDLHDFTDANLYLAEAYEKVVGREPRVGLDTDLMFMNEVARRLDLWLALRDIKFTEGMGKRFEDGIHRGEIDYYDIVALVDMAQHDGLPQFIREQRAFR